ncbi:MAG: alpha/beta hydrolase-fold protein [Acidobacteriota bacterium]
MRQTLSTAFRRVLRLENRRIAVRAGRLEKIQGFASSVLENTRDITIYLPGGYDERPERRYPVLYMADGQNLFEPERAFIPGQHWQLREAADHAIGARTAEPMIIVGVDDAGAQRIDEYTPVREEARSGGGKASHYGRFLLEELKPVVDQGFRTESARTSIAGSSLGGLLVMHLALTLSDVFESAAVISPSVWWAERAILAEVDAFAGLRRPRLWLDIGGREGREALADARALRDHLMAKGWHGENFEYYEDRRADHSERAWAGRVRTVLEFLFPLRR